ncbi:hypothetical protein [Isoptericola aurantiacus]|uniref:hypothetical protein n=1 Tax=Isoptericola aurantiacus TaxID=3377839 RepID=UPI00383AA888
MKLFSAELWRAAGLRSLQTVLVAALPFLALLIIEPSTTQLVQAGLALALALALAATLSIATSLASLPEKAGTPVPRWRAILSRTVRSFAQVFAAALAAAATFDAVAWSSVAGQAAVAAATTLVRTLIASLPEVPDPAPVGADGVPDITSLSADMPEGYELAEVSDAKTEVVDLLHQLDGEERLIFGDRQVERLLELSWRPPAS